MSIDNNPKIRIKDAWLLRQNASQHLHELWAKEGDVLADDEHMKKVVKAYRKSWENYEARVIKGMCDLYDLEFYQNLIDVYIAPWFGAFSDPLVIGVKHDPDEFVDTLTHELLHRLLTTNNKYLMGDGTTLGDEWRRLFGKEHDFNTLVHIPVHAGLKAVYLDILKEPKRLERDKQYCKEHEESWGKPYVQAWDYVEQNDYRKINIDLRHSYDKLSTQ